MFVVSDVASASVPSDEMDTDPGNEVDSDDDTSLPDIDHIRLRPMGPDIHVGGFLGASTFTLPQT